MLTITSPYPRQVNQMVLPSKQYYPVQIQATINETNSALNTIGAALDWNDGTPPVNFTPGPKPLVIDETRNLFVGSYFVTLLAWNYLDPEPQQLAAYFSIQIEPEQVIPTPDTYLFGPILPMDDGFPNATEWNFSMGANMQVLKSSVKMLLITSKGERLMLPTYGTGLRRIVFEPNDGVVAGIIQQEIDEALNQWEPRVALESIAVERPDPRSVLVNARFVSKINQSSFSLALPFTQ